MAQALERGAARAVVHRDEDRAHARLGLTRSAFFAGVADGVRTELPPELAGFRHVAHAQLLKVYYANERVHYEVWADSHRGTIEIGLHFEDGPASTANYLAYFDAYIVELKHLLGTSLELEQWTPSWGHLYELLPLTTLDAPLVERVASRLAQLIATLQPLVDAAAVAPERVLLPREERGPWRKWRRGRS